jgi:hypothetical protein
MNLEKQNQIVMRTTDPVPVKKSPPSLTTEEHERFRELINQCGVFDAGLFDQVKRLDAEIGELRVLMAQIENDHGNVGA